MNRRASIKSILTIGLIGTIYSGCDWFGKKSPVKTESLIFYKELIAELAETIIPATDTPGAKDAKVEDFIIKMILENEGSKTQKRFLSGLRNLQDYSKSRYGGTFQSCSLDNRISILEHYENKEFKYRIVKRIENELFGFPFFYKLKSLTVVGFCTSEIGATQALAYDYIPVYYQACIPLLKGQKSWATH